MRPCLLLLFSFTYHLVSFSAGSNRINELCYEILPELTERAHFHLLSGKETIYATYADQPIAPLVLFLFFLFSLLSQSAVGLGGPIAILPLLLQKTYDS